MQIYYNHIPPGTQTVSQDRIAGKLIFAAFLIVLILNKLCKVRYENKL